MFEMLGLQTLACVGRLVTSACLSVSSELIVFFFNMAVAWLLFCLLSAAEISDLGLQAWTRDVHARSGCCLVAV